MDHSRPGAAFLASVGIGTAALGLGWYATGTAEVPGMVRYGTVAGGASVLGCFIAWHRPGNRYGRVLLAIGVLFGSLVLAAAALSSTAPLPVWARQMLLAWSWLVTAALLPLWVAVIATFPDGRFHRPVLARVTVGLGVLMTLLSAAAYLVFPGGQTLPLVGLTAPRSLAGPAADTATGELYGLVSGAGLVLGAVAPLLAVVALADRYRTGGKILRQQVRWLLLGAAVSVLLQAIPMGAIDSGALRAATEVVVLLAVPLPLLAAAVAIFRHRLWEIDVVISHGLVFAVLSSVLTVAFVAGAVAAGLSVGGTDGRVVVAVALAVCVSYLARPLRQRMVSVVARLLYGEEPPGLLGLARLTRGPAVDAREQGARIADTARTALGVPWAHVWLYLRTDGAGALRPLAGSAPEPATVVVPSPAVDALSGLSGGARFSEVSPSAAEVIGPLVTDPADAVAALVVNGDLLGLVVCGARPREPFTDDDTELLELLARESALALQNIRLEDELRDRLAQIERQAADLRRSRERLVNAQDEERRRIERDLHDGVQQQLVTLATRLRHIAHAGRGAASGELTEVADEAEDAVFALQELARGIYPSVLVDRGLHVALQAHAARLPVNVRIEVDPAIHGRRQSPALEAVLYFVALEAMTNALKHAAGASISVLLRSGGPTGAVVLEVHDDGPGFDRNAVSASGLQNMTDRVEAAGGTLSVESAPGAGTWVRAEVREPATVTALRSEAASPSGRSAPPRPAG